MSENISHFQQYFVILGTGFDPVLNLCVAVFISICKWSFTPQHSLCCLIVCVRVVYEMFLSLRLQQHAEHQ